MNIMNFNDCIKLPLEIGGALPKVAIWYEDSILMSRLF